MTAGAGHWTSRLAAHVGRHPVAWISLAMGLSTALVWVRFAGDVAPLARYLDGPHYMYVAKTFYAVPSDHPFTPYDLPESYWTSHMPAYPALVRALTVLTAGNYPAAMLAATLLSSIVAGILFYRVLAEWNLVASPLWTATLFCVLPPRWLIYHSVGATEPLFFCFVFGAFLALRRERTWAVLGCVSLAALTRLTGVILIAVFLAIYLRRRQWVRAALTPLAGSGLILVFAAFGVLYGDFFASFSWNTGQVRMLRWIPMEMFADVTSRGFFHSVEMLFATYVIYAVGTLRIFRHRELFFFCLAFYALNVFIFHTDLSRFFLTLAPFALLVGFDEILGHRTFRLAMPLVLVLSYVYVWGFIPKNAVSLPVYESLLRVLHGS